MDENNEILQVQYGVVVRHMLLEHVYCGRKKR